MDLPGNQSGFVPIAPQTRDYLLAHGKGCRAVLLSAACTIDDALGVDRGHQKDGRLLFGAVRLADKTAIDAVLEGEPYDRFALPAEDLFEGGILDLRRVFMVDVRDVSEDPADRVASLTDEAALELAVRWSAYASRKGPLVAVHNSEKLAKSMARSDIPQAEYLDAVRLLAELIGTTWEIEDALERVEEVLDSDEDPTPLVTEIVGDLNAVANLANQAATAITALPIAARP